MKKIMILAAALALSSCFGDKGNYDYHPLPVVTITQVADIPAYMGETLPYTPEVAFEAGDSESNYEYHWEKSNPVGDALERQEGKTLQLNSPTAGREAWTLFVTNKQTRVSTMMAFWFRINPKYDRGWLLLSDDGGSTTLHYIRPEYEDTGKTVRKFVPFPSLSTNLGSQPTDIWQVIGGANPWPVMIAQSSSLYVNGGTLLKELDLSEEFVDGMPSGFTLKQFANKGMGGSGASFNYVLAQDGKVYVREGAGDDFINEFASFPLEYENQVLDVSEIIEARAYNSTFNDAGFIDKANKRVVWQNTSNKLLGNRGTWGASVMRNQLSADDFNFENFGDKTLVWADFFGSKLRVIYKQGSEFRMQEQTIAPNTASVPQVGVTVSKNVPIADVADQTKFFQAETKDYFFFATQNRLYWLEGTTGNTALIHTFAAGENVVSMATNPQESELGCYLSNGSFAAVNISTDKIRQGAIVGRIDGFAGTPVKVIYKFSAPYGYSQRNRANYFD